MALTPEEELELLELEEEEYQQSQQAPKTGLQKAVDISEKVTDTLGKPFEPLGRFIGSQAQKSEERGDETAEELAAKGVNPYLAATAGLIKKAPAIAAEGIAKPFEWAQKAGEGLNEYLSTPMSREQELALRSTPYAGVINPYPLPAEMSAAISTPVAMLPDLAMGVEGIAKRALIAKALKSGAKNVGKVVTSPAKYAKELITHPKSAEVAELGKEKIVDISKRQGEVMESARGAREAAKKDLIKAEEESGLHYKTTPEFETYVSSPKKMAEFTQKANRLAKQGPEHLAETMSSRDLQNFRKIAQEGEKMGGLSDIAKAELREAKKVFTDALEKVEPKVAEQLQRLRTTEESIKKIPGDTKEKILRQKRANELAKKDAKKYERHRKAFKTAAKLGLGYAGLKSLMH